MTEHAILVTTKQTKEMKMGVRVRADAIDMIFGWAIIMNYRQACWMEKNNRTTDNETYKMSLIFGSCEMNFEM